MLIPFDDYPVHQTALPLAHVGGGHQDFYDRFWFNGYTEDYYFAVALGIYPNRGIIDAAFGAVAEGWQRSVFASGRLPLDPTRTQVGPISIEITEPLRVNQVRVDAADLGITADLTFRARTAAFSEPRQTLMQGTRPVMDVTRLAQMGQWTGTIGLPGTSFTLDPATVYGTKDRSWGIRPVGQPAPAAPSRTVPQVFFLWAPLNFADEGRHFMTFEDASGKAWAKTAAVLPVIGTDTPVYGPGSEAEHIEDARHRVRWAPGLRRSQGATLTLSRGGRAETVQLEPLLTFRMRGAGYSHPTWAPAAGTMSWRWVPRSTASRSSTPSTPRVFTSSRWCAPPGASERGWACLSSSPWARMPPAASATCSTVPHPDRGLASG